MSDAISPAQLSDVASKDIPRLHLKFAKELINNPFMDCIGGEFRKEHGREPRHGLGPRACLKSGWTIFKEHYQGVADSLASIFVKCVSMEIQHQFLLRGMHKVNLCSGPGKPMPGEVRSSGMKFVNKAPTRMPTFRDIEWFKTLLTGGEKFADGTECRVLGSRELVAALLENRIFRGGRRIFHPALTDCLRHDWEVDKESEIGFGCIDTDPLVQMVYPEHRRIGHYPIRACDFSPNGYLNVLSPYVIERTSNNSLYTRLSPIWMAAPWEVFFVLGAPNFNRQVVRSRSMPEAFRQFPELYLGDLSWRCGQRMEDEFGDYGNHSYELERDYRPVCPGNVIAVLYRRLAQENL